MTPVAIPFDTLAFVKELESAGVPPVQAEAQAKALSSVLQKVEESRLKELATKGDILLLGRDIETVRKEVEAAKADTIKWTAGMFAAQTALIIGAMLAVMKMNQPTPAPQVMTPPAAMQPAPRPPG